MDLWPHWLGLPIRLMALCIWGGVAIRRKSQTAVMLWSIGLGCEIGFDLPQLAPAMKTLAEIFINLLRIAVAPLVVGSILASAVAPRGSRELERAGLIAFMYFIAVTMAALLIGFISMKLSWHFYPPVTAGLGDGVAAHGQYPNAVGDLDKGVPIWSRLLHQLVPNNIFKAFHEDNLLGLTFLSILFAVSVRTLSDERRLAFARTFELMSEGAQAFARLIMLVAPVGIAASVAHMVATFGTSFAGELIRVLIVFCTSAVMFILLALLPIACLSGISVQRFARAVVKPGSIALSTSSSIAALPAAMQSMDELKVRAPVASLVLPLGYAFNLAGTCIYLSIATLFLIKNSPAVVIPGDAQILLVLLLLSKGIPAIPRSAFVVLLGIASVLGVPPGPLFLLIMIDPIIDMVRSALNVVGNCLAAAFVDKVISKVAGNQE